MENNSAILEGLNSEQKKAVENVEGPVLIVAGAGSGKTKVLTSRIAYILGNGGDPSRILALTFTKKAAAEMRERIELMVGGVKARRLCMGTFHSVFIRFLRDYAESMGYPRDFTIYDQSDSVSAIKSCVKELGLDDKIYKPKEVLSRISMAKNNLITAEFYAGNAQLVQEDAAKKKARIADIFKLYAAKCKQSGVMDFDDILLNMNILLKSNAGALEEISSRFDYIMVDEYQDTNLAQYLIIKKLSQKKRNICVVGDDSQSIYAFRGARIENILNFRKDYPDNKTFRLEQNYRSTQVIVDAANSLIAKNVGRIPKNCYSEGAKGEKILLMKSYSEQDEALQIASAIVSRIRDEKAEYQDFAILYRTNAQSRALEEALRKRNLPYRVYSGNSFYERAEVKDMMAYLKLAVNPHDDESFKRVVNKPARGIGDTTLAILTAAAHQMGCSLMKAAMEADLQGLGMKAAALSKVRQFAGMMLGFTLRGATEDAYTLASAIAMDSGLYMFYKSDTSLEGQSKAGNVEELLNGVKSYEEDRNGTDFQSMMDDGLVEDGTEMTAVELPVVLLSEFLEDVSLLSNVDVETDDDLTNRVALMTVHSAKGLEFPYVFIAGLEENIFPSGGWLLTECELEEERRLFYVALTRAKRMVWLSFATDRLRNGKHEQNSPSRFIREIDSQYIANPMKAEAEQARENDGVTWRSAFSRGGSGYGARSGSSGGSGYGARSGAGTGIGRPVVAGARPGNFGSRTGTGGGARAAVAPVSRISSQRQSVPLRTIDFIPDPESKFREGQRVEHNKFGLGRITRLQPAERRAIVTFDDFGTKTLMLQYAKMRVVEE